MIATKINLAKIPAKKVPTKIVKADFGDGEKEYRIRALNDAGRTNLSALYSDTEDVAKTSKFFTLLLMKGLEACHNDQETAEYLLANANLAAVTVANEIMQLTLQFYGAKEAEEADALKNSESPATSRKETQAKKETVAAPETAEQ